MISHPIKVMFAIAGLTCSTATAAPNPPPTVPTVWSKPTAGNAKGEVFFSETRAGGNLTFLYDGFEISLQDNTKAMTAIRASSFSALLTPPNTDKIKQYVVTIRGAAHTAPGTRLHLAITSGETTKFVRLSGSKNANGTFRYQFAAPVKVVASPNGKSACWFAISLSLSAERTTIGAHVLAKVDSVDISAPLK